MPSASPQVRPVLIVTGSLLDPTARSVRHALQRQWEVMRNTRGAWLDVQAKLHIGELLLAERWHRRTLSWRRPPYRHTVRDYFSKMESLDLPELTEVTLATLLRDAGLEVRVATYEALHSDPKRREELLRECDCVLASSTLLRDLTELRTMVAMLSRPHNKVVVGGALTSMLHPTWQGCAGVDVLAVGSGEHLVESLAHWIRSGFTELTAPPQGRLEERGGTPVLFSGALPGKSLDHLPRPDWQLAGELHGRKFHHISYESVRGCPYRCAFCNYPFLFDDNVFRRKSAERIAEDWIAYAREGVEIITCLDSLFTLPPTRLHELCDRLIAAGSPVKWICYARADDLADLATCQRMRAAGCQQVHVGIESGSQEILNNMNKRCTVEANERALINCREVGITTVATVILGFPGETAATVQATFNMLRRAPPDIYYAAVFNTRFEYVPILEPEQRARFGLRTVRGGEAAIPYWRHNTMCASETGTWQRWLTRRMAEERVALDGALFYGGSLRLTPARREELLNYQRHVVLSGAPGRGLLKPMHGWVQRRLERDVERMLPALP